MLKENFCCKICEIFKATLSGLRQFLASKNPLKVMENAFFTSKALFVLNIFSFLPWPFGHVAKRLDKKDKSVAVSLTNNWSKRNHGIKFYQLIEKNMRKTFLEKSYIKCGGETSPRTFSKKLILSTSLDQYYSLFLLYVKLRPIKIH